MHNMDGYGLTITGPDIGCAEIQNKCIGQTRTATIACCGVMMLTSTYTVFVCSQPEPSDKINTVVQYDYYLLAVGNTYGTCICLGRNTECFNTNWGNIQNRAPSLCYTSAPTLASERSMLPSQRNSHPQYQWWYNQSQQAASVAFSSKMLPFRTCVKRVCASCQTKASLLRWSWPCACTWAIS